MWTFPLVFILLMKDSFQQDTINQDITNAKLFQNIKTLLDKKFYDLDYKFEDLNDKFEDLTDKMLIVQTDLSAVKSKLIEIENRSQTRQNETVNKLNKMKEEVSEQLNISLERLQNSKDCGQIKAPQNGTVIGTGNLFGDGVTFSCDIGYHLVGETEAMCLHTAKWSVKVPQCQRSCGVRILPSDNTDPLEASFGEFPWITRINKLNGDIVAYGALISPQWVLTRPQNVQDYSPQNLIIRVGDYNRSSVQDHTYLNHEDIPVQQIIVHPQYNVDRYGIPHNDMALIKLSQPINQDAPHIGHVCLPEQGQTYAGQRCWVLGWARWESKNSSENRNILQKQDVPIMDSSVCEQWLRNLSILSDFTLNNSTLCTGGEPGINQCMKNNAPLVCEGNGGQFSVVGIASWLVGFKNSCVKGLNPMMYTNVANYVDYIRGIIGI